jgi:hypothetical protein
MTARVFSTQSFTDAWSTQFAQVVAAAAGKDGRLSRAEAATISGRADLGRVFADDVQSFFGTSNLKSVAVSTLVKGQTAQLRAEVAQAAGADGRLSRSDAAKLSPQFRDDFLAMRAVPATPSSGDRPTPELQADVREEALRAFDSSTAQKLDPVPPALKSSRPLQTGIAHVPSSTTFDTYVVKGVIYAQRKGGDPTLDGYYQIGEVPPRGTGRADLRSQIDSITDGLDLMSESDATVHFVLGENIGQQAITPDLVRQELGAVHDTLGPTVFGYKDTDFVKLADRTTVETRDAKAFLDQQATTSDPDDPVAFEQARKWSALRTVLEQNLTDLQLYRFGDTSISVMIVGRTKNGDLAGVLSGVVET